MLKFEERLARDFSLALEEGGRYFERRGSIHETLTRLVKLLQREHIDYCITGALAMFFHGFRRFTQSVDVIVSASGLNRFSACCESSRFEKTLHTRDFRDRDTGVGLRFFLAGPGPSIHGLGHLTIPEPSCSSEEIDGILILTLPALMNLKLAVGQAPHRLMDFADVQSLIQQLGLGAEYSNLLDASLRHAYLTAWENAQRAAQDDY